MTTTPASLLERLRQPDERHSWERFVELYTPLLFHWARSLRLQESDAADLVQDVLAALVQKMPGFVYDPQKSFRSWLRAVTFNRWRDNLKQRGKLPLPGDEAALAAQAAPTEADPFWEQEYRQHLVGRALDLMRAEFQPTTWQACWEVVVMGRPAAEVATELGISENAVHIARCRVVRRLRNELQGLME
ncbi:MAG: sigma-70 family RNA polymerase sigma factor [Gemmataceae bacterium]